MLVCLRDQKCHEEEQQGNSSDRDDDEDMATLWLFIQQREGWRRQKKNTHSESPLI